MYYPSLSVFGTGLKKRPRTLISCSWGGFGGYVFYGRVICSRMCLFSRCCEWQWPPWYRMGHKSPNNPNQAPSVFVLQHPQRPVVWWWWMVARRKGMSRLDSRGPVAGVRVVGMRGWPTTTWIEIRAWNWLIMYRYWINWYNRVNIVVHRISNWSFNRRTEIRTIGRLWFFTDMSQPVKMKEWEEISLKAPELLHQKMSRTWIFWAMSNSVDIFICTASWVDGSSQINISVPWHFICLQ